MIESETEEPAERPIEPSIESSEQSAEELMHETAVEPAEEGVAPTWKPPCQDCQESTKPTEEPWRPMPEISTCTCGAALRRGFKETTKLCCPAEMEVWFTCLLDSLGYEVCSWPHIQGLMHGSRVCLIWISSTCW